MLHRPRLASTVDNRANGWLLFKLHFDKPIGEFRFYAGWSDKARRRAGVGQDI
jgi:hypothetical protein